MEYALQFAYLIGTVLTFLGLKNPPVGGHFVRKCPPTLLSRQPNVIELQGYSTLWR